MIFEFVSPRNSLNCDKPNYLGFRKAELQDFIHYFHKLSQDKYVFMTNVKSSGIQPKYDRVLKRFPFTLSDMKLL